jgi:hypothetical protein
MKQKFPLHLDGDLGCMPMTSLKPHFDGWKHIFSTQAWLRHEFRAFLYWFGDHSCRGDLMCVVWTWLVSPSSLVRLLHVPVKVSPVSIHNCAGTAIRSMKRGSCCGSGVLHEHYPRLCPQFDPSGSAAVQLLCNPPVSIPRSSVFALINIELWIPPKIDSCSLVCFFKVSCLFWRVVCICLHVWSWT